jgi:hypothetical protein
MNVGELFIQLGFQTSGMGDAQAFKGVIEAIQDAADRLSYAMVHTGLQIEKTMIKQTAPATKEARKETEKHTEANRKSTEGTKGLISALTKARLAYIGIGGAIVFATQKAAAYAQQLRVFSNVTGMSGQALQEWDQKAAAFGITAEETASTMRNLQKLATDVQLGQGNTKPWAFFGIDPRQDPTKILEQLAVKMPKFSKAISGRMAEELGLSDKFISMIYDLQKVKADKGLLLTPKELKALEKFNIYFNQTLDSMQRQLRKFGVAMMPFAEFMMYGLTRVTKGLQTFGDMFVRLNARAGDNRLFKILAVGATVLAAALFPLIFGISGVLLVWEDLMSYLRGDESVIGFWVEQFNSFAKVLENIPMLLGTVVDALTMGLFTDKITELANSAKKGLLGFFGYGEDGTDLHNRPVDAIRALNPVGPQMPRSIMEERNIGPNGTPYAVNNNQNVTVNVNGAQDPVKVGQEVNKVVRNAAFQMPIGEK